MPASRAEPAALGRPVSIQGPPRGRGSCCAKPPVPGFGVGRCDSGGAPSTEPQTPRSQEQGGHDGSVRMPVHTRASAPAPCPAAAMLSGEGPPGLPVGGRPRAPPPRPAASSPCLLEATRLCPQEALSWALPWAVSLLPGCSVAKRHCPEPRLLRGAVPCSCPRPPAQPDPSQPALVARALNDGVTEKWALRMYGQQSHPV